MYKVQVQFAYVVHTFGTFLHIQVSSHLSYSWKYVSFSNRADMKASVQFTRNALEVLLIEFYFSFDYFDIFILEQTHIILDKITQTTKFIFVSHIN